MFWVDDGVGCACFQITSAHQMRTTTKWMSHSVERITWGFHKTSITTITTHPTNNKYGSRDSMFQLLSGRLVIQSIASRKSTFSHSHRRNNKIYFTLNICYYDFLYCIILLLLLLRKSQPTRCLNAHFFFTRISI